MRLFEFSGIRISDNKTIQGDYTYQPPYGYLNDCQDCDPEHPCVHMINGYPCKPDSIKLIKDLEGKV